MDLRNHAQARTSTKTPVAISQTITMLSLAERYHSHNHARQAGECFNIGFVDFGRQVNVAGFSRLFK